MNKNQSSLGFLPLRSNPTWEVLVSSPEGLLLIITDQLFKLVVARLDFQLACTWNQPEGGKEAGIIPAACNAKPFDSKGPSSNGGSGKPATGKIGVCRVPSSPKIFISFISIGSLEGFKYTTTKRRDAPLRKSA
jgi:hypothetical protein